jgi:hypothetical protein
MHYHINVHETDEEGSWFANSEPILTLHVEDLVEVPEPKKLEAPALLFAAIERIPNNTYVLEPCQCQR